jgi:hypothetical protein
VLVSPFKPARTAAPQLSCSGEGFDVRNEPCGKTFVVQLKTSCRVTSATRHDGAMSEYLIRTASTHELPAFPSGHLADALLPAGFGCEQADGWGDFRMRCGATQIALSAEDPGWQVIVDGPMPGTDRERLVATITQQIGQAAGQHCEWLQIT